MLHIGISATIKDFEVPFFVGYFKIDESQDLRKTAAIACKNKHSEKIKEWGENWIKNLALVEVWSRETRENLLTIKI